jgi:hypothetical protein
MSTFGYDETLQRLRRELENARDEYEREAHPRAGTQDWTKKPKGNAFQLALDRYYQFLLQGMAPRGDQAKGLLVSDLPERSR